MPVTVGLPRALFHFTWGPFWEVFFAQLGAEVVVSPPTNLEIFNAGVQETVSEACMPVKVFHGHVRQLASRCDFLFVPRMVNVNQKSVFCPKFLGLPDLVRFGMPDLPQLLTPTLDLRRGWVDTGRRMLEVASRLGATPARAARALWQGRAALAAARRRLAERASQPGGLRIAVLGYPYLVHDAFMSYDVVHRLDSYGARVLTIEDFRDSIIGRVKDRLGKALFWHYTGRVVAAGYQCLEGRTVDGIVHVTAFGCGPDAIADSLLTTEASYYQEVPYLNLLVDEFTGEAGAVTRLEAFVDMLRRNRS